MKDSTSEEMVKETMVSYRVTIKDLPESERPRERMAALGAQALSNTELLAILLRTGTATESVLDVARRILTQPGGLRFLGESSMANLIAIPGIGMAKAAQIKAGLELGRRLALLDPEVRPVIRTPADVAALVMEEMRYLDREHFRVVGLNTKNQVIAVDQVSVGSLNASLVHPREVFKPMIARSAAAVVLLHNHPSGDPAPSREDIQITQRLAEAGRILGIEVLDHVVIGDNRHVSMKERGLL